MRKLRQDFGQNNVPSIDIIRQLVTKFEQNDSVKDISSTGRARTFRKSENIESVRESVGKRVETTTRCRSHELGIPQTSLSIILIEYLHLKRYKIQLT